MLSHEPMTLEQHLARVPAALTREWDQRAVLAMAQAGIKEPDRPGLHREHLFDFEHGVRVILSLDRKPNGLLVIHASVSGVDRLDAEVYLDDLGCADSRLRAMTWIGSTQGRVHHFYARAE